MAAKHFADENAGSYLCGVCNEWPTDSNDEVLWIELIFEFNKLYGDKQDN
jgi:hypothetical protein